MLPNKGMKLTCSGCAVTTLGYNLTRLTHLAAGSK